MRGDGWGVVNGDVKGVCVNLVWVMMLWIGVGCWDLLFVGDLCVFKFLFL